MEKSPAPAPIDAEPVVESNKSVAAGAPIPLCGSGQLFTGTIMNTGTTSVDINLTSRRGVSPQAFTMPPSGWIKFTNAPVFSIIPSVSATLSIIGFVLTYSAVSLYLEAMKYTEIDFSGLFTVNVTKNAKAAWYDRNPTDLAYLGYGTVSPHADTSRWLYTVPTGRKAMVEASDMHVARVTAASAAGKVDAYLFLSVYVQAVGDVLLLAEMYTNGVGDQQSAILGQSLLLLQGDKLSASDADTSTGGTIYYLESVKITEFDA